ncbi:hypothetical protein [Streptomyces sp. NPDC058664]|uniref:hypothetical protein n=1 Tax=unclassified Streptomyces TaxID=2593676 RepID=UPI0036635069
MDAYAHAPGRVLLPPIITGTALLIILVIFGGVGWLSSSSHQCKGRNNDADYNTPGEAISSRLAHIGEDAHRWTGSAAVVVFVDMCVWATIAFMANRRG